jgi:hypothetical protein
VACGVVRATADRKENAVFAGEIHTGDDISYASAPNNQTGVTVDVPVPHVTRFLILFVTGMDHRSDRGGESLHDLTGDWFSVSGYQFSCHLHTPSCCLCDEVIPWL